MQEKESTHFGYQQVETAAKKDLVAEVFHSVANRYDLMNDLMSGGLHRLWKKRTIQACAVRRGQQILDVASGTGDLAAVFAKEVGPEGHVVLSDINESMLAQGRLRLIDKGILNNVSYVLADAENLPFPSQHFDCVTIAFGLRNVTRQAKALESFFRVLKPGGKLVILEFSRCVVPGLAKIYDLYSFKVIPKLGEIITDDRKSYEYLVESIRMHPDQETLKGMMQSVGFEDVKYTNMTGGIVAMHEGYKY